MDFKLASESPKNVSFLPYLDQKVEALIQLAYEAQIASRGPSLFSKLSRSIRLAGIRRPWAESKCVSWAIWKDQALQATFPFCT